MQFESISEFLAMGGYGFYVWLSVGVCMGAMLLLVAITRVETKQVLKDIQRESARKQRMQRAKKPTAFTRNIDGTSHESST